MPRVHQQFISAMDTLVFIAKEVGWIFSPKGSLSGIGYDRETWEVIQTERARWSRLKKCREHLAYLKKQKILDSRRVGSRLEVRLNDGGFCRLLRELIKRASEFTNGLSCIIIFDIPESERALRSMFRRFLKTCGCKKIQKSVWYTNKDAAHLLNTFVKEQKLDRWIRIIKGQIL